MITSSKKSLQ